MQNTSRPEDKYLLEVSDKQKARAREVLLEISSECKSMMSSYKPRALKKGAPLIIEGRLTANASIEFLAFCYDCQFPKADAFLASFFPPQILTCDFCGAKKPGGAWDIVLARYVNPAVGPTILDYLNDEEHGVDKRLELMACYRGLKNNSPWFHNP